MPHAVVVVGGGGGGVRDDGRSRQDDDGFLSGHYRLRDIRDVSCHGGIGAVAVFAQVGGTAVGSGRG